jgi:hypothetical protein
MKPTPAKPRSSIAHVEGPGTADTPDTGSTCNGVATCHHAGVNVTGIGVVAGRCVRLPMRCVYPVTRKEALFIAAVYPIVCGILRKLRRNVIFD